MLLEPARTGTVALPVVLLQAEMLKTCWGLRRVSTPAGLVQAGQYTVAQINHFLHWVIAAIKLPDKAACRGAWLSRLTRALGNKVKTNPLQMLLRWPVFIPGSAQVPQIEGS